MVLDVKIIEESIPDYSEEVDNPGAIFVRASDLPTDIFRQQVEIESRETEYHKIQSADELSRCLDCKKFLFTTEELNQCLSADHNVEKLKQSIKYTTIPDLRNYKHWSCYNCDRLFYSLDTAASCYANDHDIEQKERLPVKPTTNEYNLEDDDTDIFEDDREHNWLAYVEKITQGAWSDYNFVRGYSLPGMNVSRESCGNWYTDGCIGAVDSIPDTRASKESHAAHMESGKLTGVIKKKVMHCNKASCIICCQYTFGMQASKAAERMQAFLGFLDSNIFKIHKKRIFNHFVVAVNPSLSELMKSHDFRKKTEASIRNDLKQLSVEGGAVIFHGYAFSKNLQKPVWRPHFHFVLTGYTESADIVSMHAKTGHVYRSVRTLTEGHDVFGLFRYLASHATLKASTHSIRYFGLAQNKNFQTAKVLLNSSECNDNLDDILTGVESGSLLPKRYSHIKIKQCDLQYFNHGVEFDMDNYGKSKVYNFSDDHIMKRAADDIKEHTRKDNPAIPKSELSFAAMRFSFTANRTGKDGIIEECDIEKLLIIRLDPSLIGLCPICQRKIRHIVPKDPSMVPEINDDEEHTLIDGEKYEYYEHFIHGKEGFPYYNESNIVQRDIGQLIKNVYYDTQVLWLQTEQMDGIETGMKSVFRHEFLDGNTKPDYAACFDYVADRMEYWRKEVRGITVDTIKVNRDLLVNKDIKSGKQKLLF